MAKYSTSLQSLSLAEVIQFIYSAWSIWACKVSSLLTQHSRCQPICLLQGMDEHIIKIWGPDEPIDTKRMKAAKTGKAVKAQPKSIGYTGYSEYEGRLVDDDEVLEVNIETQMHLMEQRGEVLGCGLPSRTVGGIQQS